MEDRMKIILKPKKSNEVSEGLSRITLQFRKYNREGKYEIEDDEKGTETIHLKNCNLIEAFEIVKSALMNSRLIDENFEVEN
jgi:hypothetical protein